MQGRVPVRTTKPVPMTESTYKHLSPTYRPDGELSYEAALERVMSLADFERSSHSPHHSAFHLERMGLLMEALGNPHLGIPTVHIAGTKGKGSTASMVASILRAEDYKVGLYTSPHLHSAVERIRVGLEPIRSQGFASLVERSWPVADRVAREGGFGGVTTFEMLTAMAFRHFKEVGSDFQVIEVGLGGRLDSTNVVEPTVCAITSISLDHQSTLGNTVAQIAREKAGIIKYGVPVVLAPQPDQALEVFLEVAKEREAPVVQVDSQVSWRKGQADLEGQSFEVSGLRDQYDLRTPLLGDHQLENACTAIATVESLVARGFRISKESIVRGLKEVRWPARLEVLRRDGPSVIVDGAHNPYSMSRLVEAVRQYFRPNRVIVIFGALGGHSAKGMLSALAGVSPLVIATRSRHPRSTSSDKIAKAASVQGLQVAFQSDDVGEATRRGLDLAGDGDLVLGTGSLSVAAEVIEEIKGIAPELYPYIKRPATSAAATHF